MFVIQHIPSGEYLYGNRTFCPELKHVRIFDTFDAATSHQLPLSKMLDCKVVEVEVEAVSEVEHA